MLNKQHFRTLNEARIEIRKLHNEGELIGSIHTLGALHKGHGKIINLAASENKYVIVTIYPNKTQFAPNTKYIYDLDQDIQFAFDHGATHVISSSDDEIYPVTYRTFLDQGDCYSRLDGTVVPFLFRGMITQCIRWISFVRPHNTYWGLKDIGQTILVKRAVEDLLIDTQVREVPCIRFLSGVPISSRLLKLDIATLREVAHIYSTIKMGLNAIAAGERKSIEVVKLIKSELDKFPLLNMRIHYIKIAEPQDFLEPTEITIPFIIHVVVTNGHINHFDGIFIRNNEELHNGSKVLWLEEEYPNVI